MIEMYYFGCPPGDIGHYYLNDRGRTVYEVETLVPWQRIDGMYAPRLNELGQVVRLAQTTDREERRTRECPQGHVLPITLGDWTIYAWWDRSADKRGASNSALIVRKKEVDETCPTCGHKNLKVVAAQWEEILEEAKKRFPWVFSRMTFPLILISQ